MNTELIEKLKNHDWTYEYSDDHNTWRKGQAERREILSMVKTISDVATALAFAQKVPEGHRAAYIEDVQKELKDG